MFSNLFSDPLNLVLSIPAILIAFTFHEYAHAIVADRLGDRTPRFQGRITLNPIAHLDIVGFICFLLFRFGWAKPVQTNPTAFKRFYKDHLKVSAAGPIANLIVALVFAPISVLFVNHFGYEILTDKLLVVINGILFNIVFLNVVFFVLNLIPIPGLDGWHILSDLFPSTFNRLNYQMGQYQMFIMLIFIATPIATYIVGRPAILIYENIIDLFNSILPAI